MTVQPQADPDIFLEPWWQPIHLESGRCWHYMVGPLSLYLQRRKSEWLLAWENRPDAQERYKVISESVATLPDGLSVSRYVFQNSPAAFCLKPRLLDRPVVVKTNHPVIIPPGEEITFFISSPVYVSVELREPAMTLQEIATLRLSDTWFGPSTRVGELCYAAKTHARNDKSEVPLRPHRAVTPVTIHNRSQELLAIEKLSIPVPFLAVYGQDDGTLWTDPVSLEHTEGNQLATLKIGRKPYGAEPLSAARTPPQRTNVVRAFINMFSG